MENGARLLLEEVSRVLSVRDLPSQPMVSVATSDGLSKAVSPWKYPPAWSPPGILKSRCPPIAELCSTFCNQAYCWSQRFLILIT